MTTYTVKAARHGDWWALHANVPDAAVWTQCRRLDQAEGVARDAIAMALDVPADSFDVEVESALEARLRPQVEAAVALSQLATQAQQAATLMNTSAARALRSDGLSVGDAGTLLSLSAQRISQLAPGADPGVGGAAVREAQELVAAIEVNLREAKAALRAAAAGGRSRHRDAG